MTTKERALTGDAVHNLFLSLLCEQDFNNAVIVEGLMITVGFHPDKLEAARDEVKAMLEELPDAFRKSKGGGWSFLNMYMSNDDVQWTGLHSTQEELCLMGLGLGLLEYLMPRDMWKILPGGMPYLVYKDS